jgi:SAM-dependent methyltransferase
MTELHRVLKPGGWAILMCPVDHSRASTFEDPAIITPEERHRAFGQSDHLRLYGRDYPERLSEAGFTVRAERYADRFDQPTIERLGLRREDDEAFGEEEIYFCAKPDGAEEREDR